jgi:hypothetical protein
VKIKTSELEDLALDWAVTKCEGYDHKVTSSEWGMWGWATVWAQGGPLIEREGIRIVEVAGDVWGAVYSRGDVGREHFAETPLIAAMRCYVASKLGDEVEIPEELA